MPTITDDAIADEAIAAGRVVRVSTHGHAVLARPPEAQAVAPWGVTHEAVAAGEQAHIVKEGVLYDPAWTFSPGPVLLGSDGRLVQGAVTQNDYPWFVVLGWAISPQLLVLRIEAPVFFAVA